MTYFHNFLITSKKSPAVIENVSLPLYSVFFQNFSLLLFDFDRAFGIIASKIKSGTSALWIFIILELHQTI